MCRGRRVEDEDGASGRGRRGRVQRFMDVVKDMERVGVTGGDGDMSDYQDC